VSYGDDGGGLVVRDGGVGITESASRPIVDFGVANDNLIKGLISCVKCISGFLMKVQMYSFIHHLKYNYEANETM
jgi:hypothetical protein